MWWIGLVLKILKLVFSIWVERNKVIRQKKKEALDAVLKGVRDKDPSAITAGFDKVNRI